MKLLSIFLIPLLVLSLNAKAKDLKFYTEDAPPYNFKEGGEVKGYAVDLIKRTLQVSNIPVTKDTIKLIPWARGIKLTQKKGLHNVLFTTVRVPPREKKWKWVGPIDKPITFALFAKKGTPESADLKDILKDKIAEFGFLESLLQTREHEALLLRGFLGQTRRKKRSYLH